jgi:uncharacterized membrane protein YhdT
MTFQTTNAGLHLYCELWKKFDIGSIIDDVKPKQSGSSNSEILQNLAFRGLIDANSMVALSEKDKEEYFLVQNASLDRTTYGRALKRFDDSDREKILLKFDDQIIPKKRNKHELMILDKTAIPAAGEEYPDTKWVYDSCLEKMIMGYGLNTLLLSLKGKITISDFNLDDDSKESHIKLFEKCRRETGINKIVIDAGPDLKGEDFFQKIIDEEFLFYTKATKSWLFNYGKTMNVTKWRKQFFPLIRRNGIISRIMYFREIKLRLIFVKGDRRVFLTNDFKSKATDIVKYYGRRWAIEVSFREEKQNLGLTKLPCWSNLDGIKTHILLVFLIYILSQFIIKKVKKLAKGIELIKRKLVNVFARIKERYGKIIFEFENHFKLGWVFQLELG